MYNLFYFTHDIMIWYYIYIILQFYIILQLIILEMFNFKFREISFAHLIKILPSGKARRST